MPRGLPGFCRILTPPESPDLKPTASTLTSSPSLTSSLSERFDGGSPPAILSFAFSEPATMMSSDSPTPFSRTEPMPRRVSVISAVPDTSVPLSIFAVMSEVRCAVPKSRSPTGKCVVLTVTVPLGAPPLMLTLPFTPSVPSAPDFSDDFIDASSPLKSMSAVKSWTFTRFSRVSAFPPRSLTLPSRRGSPSVPPILTSAPMRPSSFLSVSARSGRYSESLRSVSLRDPESLLRRSRML